MFLCLLALGVFMLCRNAGDVHQGTVAVEQLGDGNPISRGGFAPLASRKILQRDDDDDDDDDGSDDDDDDDGTRTRTRSSGSGGGSSSNTFVFTNSGTSMDTVNDNVRVFFNGQLLWPTTCPDGSTPPCSSSNNVVIGGGFGGFTFSGGSNTETSVSEENGVGSDVVLGPAAEAPVPSPEAPGPISEAPGPSAEAPLPIVGIPGLGV